MSERLAGRVGVITGGAGGIGGAGARLFAQEGAALALLDMDEEQGNATVKAIGDDGGRAVFVRGDASDPADVERLVRTAVDEYGKLDLLWANAGTGVARSVPDMSLEEWNRVVAVNLTGSFLLGKYGIPEVAKAGGGTMVITGSANSFRADRQWAAYCQLSIVTPRLLAGNPRREPSLVTSTLPIGAHVHSRFGGVVVHA